MLKEILGGKHGKKCFIKMSGGFDFVVLLLLLVIRKLQLCKNFISFICIIKLTSPVFKSMSFPHCDDDSYFFLKPQ